MTYVPPDPDAAPAPSELDQPRFRVEFMVYGTPQPKGSKRGFLVKRKTGKTGVAIVDDNPNTKSWQGLVAEAAVDVMEAHAGPDAEPELITGPVGVSMEFRFKRPLGHWGSGRNVGFLRGSAPSWPIVRPDVDKLLRAVFDALIGVVWRDDAQVVELYAAKRYATPEGVHVVIWGL